jgi:uncharacterized membrane protein YeaQ/YmgE (transglycosylase-associated protein family)
MHVLIFIVIGLMAGALAGRVVSGHGYGLLGDIVVGISGSLLAGWLFAACWGVVAGPGFFMSLFSAFIGAVVLLGVIRLVVPARA